MKLSKTQINTIVKITHKLNKITEKWAIIGSFGQALQGVEIVPNDIDIITTKKGAYEIASKFKDCIGKEVSFSSTTKMRSYFGILKVEGFDVEFFGDIENKTKDGIWKPHHDWEKKIIIMQFGNINIPVISLEFELQICKREALIEKKLYSDKI